MLLILISHPETISYNADIVTLTLDKNGLPFSLKKTLLSYV